MMVGDTEVTVVGVEKYKERTIKQLRAKAKSLGIKNYGRKNKQVLAKEIYEVEQAAASSKPEVVESSAVEEVFKEFEEDEELMDEELPLPNTTPKPPCSCDEFDAEGALLWGTFGLLMGLSIGYLSGSYFGTSK